MAAVVAGAGAGLSALTAPALAVASAVAFLVAERADFAVYTPLRRRGWARAVAASNADRRPAFRPGVTWAGDNGRYGEGWPGEDAWFAWPTRHADRAAACLFAVAPDMPFDAAATLASDMPFDTAATLAPSRAVAGNSSAAAREAGADRPATPRPLKTGRTHSGTCPPRAPKCAGTWRTPRAATTSSSAATTRPSTAPSNQAASLPPGPLPARTGESPHRPRTRRRGRLPRRTAVPGVQDTAATLMFQVRLRVSVRVALIRY